MADHSPAGMVLRKELGYRNSERLDNRIIRDAPAAETAPSIQCAISTGYGRRMSTSNGSLPRSSGHAGAASLAPDVLVARARHSVVVVAREELALVDRAGTISALSDHAEWHN